MIKHLRKCLTSGKSSAIIINQKQLLLIYMIIIDYIFLRELLSHNEY